MSILRTVNLSRRRFAAACAAVRRDTTVWAPAPLLKVKPAADSLFHIAIDVSDFLELRVSYAKAGQYLQMRIGAEVGKSAFLAIASPPGMAREKGVFEFLVKSVEGSKAEAICGLQKGDVVEVSSAMGAGFDLDRISPPEEYQSVLIFATVSGISPICSLIESDFDADKRSDVRLYYRAGNLRRMAYQSSGVKVVPVLSQPDGKWCGGTGFVQAAFAKAKKLFSPSGTGTVLCGQKQMAEI